MNILIVNDDGIDSKALQALAIAFSKIANVFVAAPKEQQSAVGNAMTLHKPLMYNKYDLQGIPAYYIEGTPADCCKMAMHVIFKDITFDYVFSGINVGINTGINALYSGTISAATEAAIIGKKAIAFSLQEPSKNIDSAVAFALEYFEEIKNIKFPKGTLLNVNIPDIKREDFKGVKLTKQGNMGYRDSFEERQSPRGHFYYWQKSQIKDRDLTNCEDYKAVKDGYVSITPLGVDRTDYSFLKELGYEDC